MLSKQMYSDVLQLKDQIRELDSNIYPEKDHLINKAALGLMENALKAKECQLVLDIQNDYNISVSSRWDEGLYECFIKAADYQKAKKIVKRNLSTQDLSQKQAWLYRLIEVDFATGNYSDVVDEAKDLITLSGNIENSPYKGVYRFLFDAYERLGDFEGMVDSIAKIESIFGLNYKDIDRYVAMINVGVEKKDDTIIIKYAKKLFDLQRRIKSFAQSPFVEFALYSAYMNKGEYKKALEVIELLDELDLTNKQRARQQYQKGVVLEKLWRDKEAKKAYEKALEADSESAWGKLAKSALSL
jgi:tetratricopeptide (TPR) repeat protein